MVVSAPLSLQPSIILAWFNSSQKTISFFFIKAESMPMFAWYPELKIKAEFVFLKCAIFFSNSLWSVIVPEIRRDAPEPHPNSLIALLAAFLTEG